MYKTKTGGLVPRPTQIGNTFIGAKTDLGQYGYYTVTNPTPPTDAPEGQRYVNDPASGTYDEQAMTYTVSWVLETLPEPEAEPTPDYGTKIALYFFRQRFTPEEKEAIYTAAETNVSLRIFLDDLSSVKDSVDLSLPQLDDALSLMVTSEILTEERKVAILTDPVQEHELP